jgi:ribonuclease P protein subunit POP4
MIKEKTYSIGKTNIFVHEIIGLTVKVTKAADTSLQGLKGTVIDEHQNTFTLDTKQGLKTIPKKNVFLNMTLGKESVVFNASRFIGKPVERLKLNWRKLYG